MSGRKKDSILLYFERTNSSTGVKVIKDLFIILFVKNQINQFKSKKYDLYKKNQIFFEP